MTDDISLKLPARLRGRPLERGRSCNPGGRRRGSRNRATPAAAGSRASPGCRRARPTRWRSPVAPSSFTHIRKLGQVGPVCHRLNRWERRRERGLRDRVRREREAVSLAHTRPAGWPISVTANQPTQATGQVSFRIGGDDPSKRRAPGGPLRCGRARFVFQSIREILLQICCRRSHRQQLIQLMIAGLKTGAGRLHPIGKPPQDRFALNEGKGR